MNIGIYVTHTKEFESLRREFNPIKQTIVDMNFEQDNIGILKNEIELKLIEIKNNIDELKKLQYDNNYNVGFFNENDKFKKKIEDKSNQISTNIQQCVILINKIKTFDKNNIIYSNMQRFFTSELQENIQKFKQYMTQYVNTTRVKQTINDDLSFDSISNDSNMSEQILISQQLIDQNFTDEIQMQHIKQRETDINRIVNSIEELNIITRDMNILIIEQGTVLDRIESNMFDANINLEQGNNELVATNTLQKKAGKKYICIVILLIIVALIIGTVVYFKTK